MERPKESIQGRRVRVIQDYSCTPMFSEGDRIGDIHRGEVSLVKSPTDSKTISAGTIGIAGRGMYAGDYNYAVECPVQLDIGPEDFPTITIGIPWGFLELVEE